MREECDIKIRGISCGAPVHKRVHYPFGKKSRARTTFICPTHGRLDKKFVKLAR